MERHLIYQRMGFKIQVLKKEVFMECMDVYVLKKIKNYEIFVLGLK